MFFRTPDDLLGLDVEGGECWNRSVVQNVSFGVMGLPGGRSTSNPNKTSGAGGVGARSVGVAVGVALALVGSFAGL